MEWTALHQDSIVKIAGPGGWNDPDMASRATTPFLWQQKILSLAIAWEGWGDWEEKHGERI